MLNLDPNLGYSYNLSNDNSFNLGLIIELEHGQKIYIHFFYFMYIIYL